MGQKEFLIRFLKSLIETLENVDHVTGTARFSRDIQPVGWGGEGEFQEFIDTGTRYVDLELVYQETSPHRLGDRIPDSQSGD